MGYFGLIVLNVWTVFHCRWVRLTISAQLIKDDWKYSGYFIKFASCEGLISALGAALVMANKSVIFLSHRFQTELGYDILEIHDGPNLLSSLIGSFNGTQVPQFLFSSSNFLYLLFITDNSRSNVGFKILYESKLETKCGDIVNKKWILFRNSSQLQLRINPVNVAYLI